MSELSINDLPFEMLAKVFWFLDTANLKSATLTCKLWKNLIESECRWSLKLKYKDSGKHWGPSEQKLNFVLMTYRKFRTIEIEGGPIYQGIQRHGLYIVKLTLIHCRIQNFNQFADVLNFTPNLEHIVIHQMKYDVSDDLLDHDLPALKKLKNLEIIGNQEHEQIVKCFRKAKLRYVIIGSGIHSKQHSALVDFLLSQDMLTSLAVISGSSRSILTEMGKSNVPIPFRLTHLLISGTIIPGDSLHNDNNRDLLRFVQSQAKHLRQLQLGRCIPHTVYELAFSSMTQLNSLCVDINRIPQDNEFYDRLKENCNIRTIRLVESCSHSNQRCIASLFKKLPNICNIILSIASYSSIEALVMAQRLSKAESTDKQSIDCGKFCNLKTLHIEFLSGKVNWNEFTKANPLLTELTVVYMMDGCFTSDDIDQITTIVDLHTIRLGSGFVADDRFFDIIRVKCINLKMLNLHRSSLPHGLNDNMRINALRLSEDFKCSIYFNWDL